MSTYIFIGISHSLTIMKLMMDIWYVLRVLNLQRPFFGFLQSLIVLKLRVNRWCILVFLSCIYVLSFRSYLILIAPPLSLTLFFSFYKRNPRAAQTLFCLGQASRAFLHCSLFIFNKGFIPDKSVENKNEKVQNHKWVPPQVGLVLFCLKF